MAQQQDGAKGVKPRPDPADEPPEDGASDTAKIAAIVFVLVLVVGCIWLFNRLSSANQELNCVASGRHDCASATP
jgi:flagellar biogenesis protein FliO